MLINSRTLVCLIPALAWGAVLEANCDEEIAYLRLSDGFWQTWLTDRAGTCHRQLTFDAVDKSRVFWGSSGIHIWVNANDGSLLAYEKVSGMPIEGTHEMIGALDIVGSLDDGDLLFSRAYSSNLDNTDLWIKERPGGHEVRVSTLTSAEQAPNWGRNGSLVYVIGDSGQDYQVWEMDRSGRNREQRTLIGSMNVDPALSVHNDLAFASNRTGDFELWVIPEDRSEPKRLTDSIGYDGQPSWSGDGRQLAYYSIRNGTSRIWRLDLSTGEHLPITPPAVKSRAPAWSHVLR